MWRGMARICRAVRLCLSFRWLPAYTGWLWKRESTGRRKSRRRNIMPTQVPRFLGSMLGSQDLGLAGFLSESKVFWFFFSKKNCFLFGAWRFVPNVECIVALRRGLRCASPTLHEGKAQTSRLGRRIPDETARRIRLCLNAIVRSIRATVLDSERILIVTGEIRCISITNTGCVREGKSP